MLTPISLDKFIVYDPEEVTPTLFLSAFGQPLSRAEHYSLAKRLYPCRYIDSETSHEWHLGDASEEGFSPVDTGDMILIENTTNGEYVFHWSFARRWSDDELWAHDRAMLPDNARTTRNRTD